VADRKFETTWAVANFDTTVPAGGVSEVLIARPGETLFLASEMEVGARS
jgi:hypothetical protein